MLLSLSFAATILVGCVESSVVDISKTEFVISSDTECGKTAAASITSKLAAIEVIRRGYDRYVVTSLTNTSQLYSIPLQYGGVYSTNGSDLRVKMVAKGERGYTNALDARSVLGSNWRELVETGINSCS